MTSTIAAKTPRDARLDFFRGLAMLIIFVVHVPGGNFWAWYIPAAFGHSSAVEMFVFCSGFASALAFASVFDRHGFLIGTARVAHRIWQVYWAHIGLFLVISLMCVLGTHYLGTRNYVQQLNLVYFFENAEVALPALLTLRYVPNLFDILPMYIALLATIPFVMLAHRIHPWSAFALVLGLYASAWIFDVNFSAHPELEIGWLFNPFGWSLCFFAGFFFAKRWLPAPRLGDPRLLAVAVVILVVSLPLRQWQLYRIDLPSYLPFVAGTKDFFFPEHWLGYLHWMRLVHFFALAYVCLSILNNREHWLHAPIVRPIIKVGQQSLAAFLSSLGLGWLVGMLLDLTGRDAVTVSLANLVSFAVIVGIAYTVGWYKAQPWRRQPQKQDDRPRPAERAQPIRGPGLPQAAPAE